MVSSMNSDHTRLTGVGLGLRAPHYQEILQQNAPDMWFEVLIDNYMGEGGLPLHYLRQISERHACTFHGVGMSLGSTDPLDDNYLNKLAQRVREHNPVHISDHLCWSSAAGVHGHDLFPMPYTDEAVVHLADRISRVQDRLGQQILIENVSSYLEYKESYLTEVDFLCAVIERADCHLLCDINNIYVSARNHNFDPADYLARLPAERVKEFHLAGFEDMGSHLLDTHGAPVHGDVWDLYRTALQQFGPVPTLIEWDTDIPSYATLLKERHTAEQHLQEVFDVSAVATA